GLAAVVTVIVSLAALARLWQTGDQGRGRALFGLFFGLLGLLPYGYFGSLAWRYPDVTDIATTDRQTMPLVFDPEMTTMPAPKVPTAAQMQAVFPNVATRRYGLGVVPTFALVERLVAGHGWQVRLTREPADNE